MGRGGREAAPPTGLPAVPVFHVLTHAALLGPGLVLVLLAVGLAALALLGLAVLLALLTLLGPPLAAALVLLVGHLGYSISSPTQANPRARGPVPPEVGLPVFLRTDTAR